LDVFEDEFEEQEFVLVEVVEQDEVV